MNTKMKVLSATVLTSALLFGLGTAAVFAENEAPQVKPTVESHAIQNGFAVSASARISRVVKQMTDLAAKLQTRVTAAQTAGHDVTALTAALADLHAKLADATTLSASITTAAAATPLTTPNHANKAQVKANHTALKQMQTIARNAERDLVAARKDAATIRKGLAAFNVAH